MDELSGIPKVSKAVEPSQVSSGSQSSAPAQQTGAPSGASTIEESKNKAVPIAVPLPNLPLLMTPTAQGSVSFAIGSAGLDGKVKVEFLQSIVNQQQETVDQMLDDWSNNLKQIAEEVQRRINSPLYQELEQLRLKGIQEVSFPATPAISASGSSASKGPVEISAVVSSRNEVIEKIAPADKSFAAESARDSTQVMVVPTAVALLVAGGMGIAHIDPATKALDLVEGLKSLCPSLSVTDIVPLINLLVIGPIYVQSWEEAISRLKDKERTDYKEMAQKFSEDVLKITADPLFVLEQVVKKMQQSVNLDPKAQEKLVIMLKLILCGVALSFLYAAEVGKVQNDKFGGLEPEEVKALLLGEFIDEKKAEDKYESTVKSMVEQAQKYLLMLAQDERIAAVEQLLAYIYGVKEINALLEPSTIFEKVLASMQFDSSKQRGDFV